MSQTQPLHQRRPDWLLEAIVEDYETANGRYSDYAYNGEPTDYDFNAVTVNGSAEMLSRPPLLASDLIEKAEADFGRKLRILDIGAGAGNFALKYAEEGHDVQALSALDYRNRGWRSYRNASLELDADSYVVDDAHHLGEIPELRDEYDLITSRLCFLHLIDPLGALEQALAKLGENGQIVIDQLTDRSGWRRSPYQGEITANQLLADLRANGFDASQSFPARLPYLPRMVLQPLVARRIEVMPVALSVDYLQR